MLTIPREIDNILPINDPTRCQYYSPVSNKILNSSFKSLTEIGTVWYRFVNVVCLTYGVHNQQHCQNEIKIVCQCDNDCCGK